MSKLIKNGQLKLKMVDKIKNQPIFDNNRPTLDNIQANFDIDQPF